MPLPEKPQWFSQYAQRGQLYLPQRLASEFDEVLNKGDSDARKKFEDKYHRAMGSLFSVYANLYTTAYAYGASEKSRATPTLALLRETARNSAVDKLIIETYKDLVRQVSGRVRVDNHQKGFCLPTWTSLHTDHGRLTIGKIVANKLKVKVKSFLNGRIVYSPITNWFSRKNSETLWCLEWGRGGRGARLISTQEHQVLTSRGWLPASAVTLQDSIAVAHPKLSAAQEQIVLGTLLGDGSIERGGEGGGWPRLSVRHGETQFAYLQWMADALRELEARTKPVLPCKHPAEIKGRIIRSKPQRYFRTHALASLWQIYEATTKKGRKFVSSVWLDQIQPLGLAVWAMDDGSVSVAKNDSRLKRPRQNPSVSFVFCTDGFSRIECDAICQWFKTRWGIETKIQSRKNGDKVYFRIALGTEATEKFKALVAPYIEISSSGKKWLYPTTEPCAQEPVCVRVSKIGPYANDPKRSRTVYDISVDATSCFLVNDAIVHNSVKHVRYRDPYFKAEADVERRCREMEDLIDSPNPEVHPNGFKDVVSVLVEEMLVIDRGVVIKEGFNYKKQPLPNLWHCISGDTVKPRLQVVLRHMADNTNNVGGGVTQDSAVQMILQRFGVDVSKAAYIQDIDNRIYGAWDKDSCAVLITNPSSEINRFGYGMSPLEQSLSFTTFLMMAFHYNQQMFMSSYPEAFLVLKGAEIDQAGLESFKAQLYAECYDWHTRVNTKDYGRLPIGVIVNKRLKTKVESFDRATGQVMWKPITNWIKNRGEREWIVLTYHSANSKEPIRVIMTPGQELWDGKRMIKASTLKAGDEVGTLARGLWPSLVGVGVISVEHRHIKRPRPSYDIEVADTHTFFPADLASSNCGPQGNSRLPIIPAAGNDMGAELLKLRDSMTDMDFVNLIKLALALKVAAYGSSPELINFAPFGGGSIIEKGATGQETRVAYEKDRGYRRILDSICDFFTRNFIRYYYDDLVMVYSIQDEPTEQERIELATKELAIGLTVDEYRAQRGMKPLEEVTGIKGNFINSPFYLQWAEAQRGQAAAEARQDTSQFTGSAKKGSKAAKPEAPKKGAAKTGEKRAIKDEVTEGDLHQDSDESGKGATNKSFLSRLWRRQ